MAGKGRSPMTAKRQLRPGRWLLKTFFMLLLVAGVALAVGIGPLFLQDEPILEAAAPPSPEDVLATRQLVRDIRGSAASGALLQSDAMQLNSTIRLGSRFIDGFRGDVEVQPSQLLGRVSVPVQWWTGPKWLNMSGHVPEFEGTVSLSQLTIGSTDVSPGFALGLARLAANLGVGNQFGDKVLSAASAMTISKDKVAFKLQIDDVGKNGVMRGVFGSLRGQDMPQPDEIETYNTLIRTAIDDGHLPEQGSFLPYIQFALNAAWERSDAETLPNAYTAAIFGLAKACGARDFAMIVGRLAFADTAPAKNWQRDCREVTLNGRIDSRRHFITSSALQAASNTGFAVSVGEFKELYDTISGAGGFDFTDMAANLSGVRMSNYLMAQPHDTWPNALNRLNAEKDVIIGYEGIPQLMPEAQFEAEYGDVESAPYKQMIDKIEGRIDQLGLYTPG